jgi:hypothetical protein
MPSATFVADFSSFNAAVQKAEVHLSDFQQGASRVEKALQRMADNFSGKKVVQDATLMAKAIEDTGGVSKLTGTQLEQAGRQAAEALAIMKARGLEVPPALRAIADAAAEVERRSSAWERAAAGLSAFASGARTVGLGLSAAVTAPIVAAGAAITKLGIDAVESESLVSVSFGDMRKAADDWSKGLSTALGLNEFELRKQAGTLFTMTTSMGLSREAAFEMSTGIAKLAADMASFRNIGMGEALEKIRSGIVGESEPLKALGILVDEATVKTYAYKSGIAEFGAELTQQQKVAARWGAILQQTTNDQGDLARTLKSPANELRTLQTRLEEAATALGLQLMPYIEKAVTVLADFGPKVKAAAEWFGQLPEPVKSAVLGLSALLAVAGPVTYGLGTMAGAIEKLIPLVRTLATLDTAAGLAGIVSVMSNPAVLAAAAVIGGIGFAVYNFNQNLKALEERGRSVGQIIPGALNDMGNKVVSIDGLTAATDGLGKSFKMVSGHLVEVAKDAAAAGGFEALTEKIKAADAAIAALSETQRSQLSAALQAGVSDMKELQERTGLSEAALRRFKESSDEAAKAQQKYRDALADLKATGDGWKGTLDTIDGAVVEGAKALLQAGMSAERVATLYALLPPQLAAVEKSLDSDTAALKRQSDTIAAVSKLWSEYFGLRERQGATDMDQQVAEIQRWYDEQVAAAKRAGTLTGEFYAALDAERQAKLAQISTDWAAINATMTTESQRGLQQFADRALATYQEALKHVGEWKDGTIEAYRRAAEAAQMAANNFGAGFTSNAQAAAAALDSVIAKVDEVSKAISGVFAGQALPSAESLTAAAGRPGSLLGFSPGLMVQSMLSSVANLPWPARATGGNVSAGQTYMVGERGPELFTPGSSGFITPNGSAGGVGPVTINVSGVMDPSTASQLADAVERELMRRMARRLPGA